MHGPFGKASDNGVYRVPSRPPRCKESHKGLNASKIRSSLSTYHTMATANPLIPYPTYIMKFENKISVF